MSDLPISQADYVALRQYIAQALTLPAIQLEAVILFGSKARGDAGPESDIDLMLILRDDALPQRQQLYALVFDVLLESGVYLSTQIMSAELFQQLPVRRPLLYANLIRDGILLYVQPGLRFPEFTNRVEWLAVA